MRNIVSRFAFAVCVTVFAASCADSVNPPVEEEVATSESKQEPPDAGFWTFKNYFSDSTFTQQVGWCVQSTCPLQSNCNGQLTQWVQSERVPCGSAAQ